LRTAFTVILPAAAPTILTGMRISIGIALCNALVALCVATTNNNCRIQQCVSCPIKKKQIT